MFLHISLQRVALSKSILSINEEEAYKLASILSKVPLLYKYGLTLTIDIQHIEYRLSIFTLWLTTLHCQTTSLKIDIQHITGWAYLLFAWPLSRPLPWALSSSTFGGPKPL